MKNTPSQTKNNYSESPKTPGGISKSLLTPCRRVGLSRNWRKGSVSPFVSPLSNGSTSADTQNEPRKRKKGNEPDQDGVSNQNDDETCVLSCNSPITTLNRTPSRSVIARKKSKTLLLTNQDTDDIVQTDGRASIDSSNHTFKKISPDNSCSSKEISEEYSEQSVSKVSKLSRLSLKNKSFTKTDNTDKAIGIQNIIAKESTKNSINLNKNDEVNDMDINENSKDKSPNNLSKNCIAVIQKNIFKSVAPNEEKSNEKNPSKSESDSDDDVPLSNLSSKENIHRDITCRNDSVVNKINVKKIDKTTSVTNLKVKSKVKEKSDKNSSGILPSQSLDCFNEDDNDFKVDRRTIIVKKSYSKLGKPAKAKSTGSISQKDIDEIQARIAMKKNLLLAKAMSYETEELRDLIRKWQQGCQSALTELFELMKKKMPEQPMGYSEMLKMLKIPPDLVGYDSDNDCFVTPDDKNIIMSGLKLNNI